MSQAGEARAPACPAFPGLPGWAHLPFAASLSSHAYGSACPSLPADCLGFCQAQGPSPSGMHTPGGRAGKWRWRGWLLGWAEPDRHESQGRPAHSLFPLTEGIMLGASGYGAH